MEAALLRMDSQPRPPARASRASAVGLVSARHRFASVNIQRSRRRNAAVVMAGRHCCRRARLWERSIGGQSLCGGTLPVLIVMLLRPVHSSDTETRRSSCAFMEPDKHIEGSSQVDPAGGCTKPQTPAWASTRGWYLVKLPGPLWPGSPHRVVPPEPKWTFTA